MTVTVPLTPEQEARLTAIAEGLGLSADALVQSAVEELFVRNVLSLKPTDLYDELRREIVASGLPVLGDEDLRQEIRERRGITPGRL